MAHVTIPPEPDDDRAQMLLVGAFGLAVMLVVLALVLNTAIYTENIATRGGDIIGGKDALQYRHAVESGTAGTIVYVNYHNNTSIGNVRDTANDTMSAWNNLSAPAQGLQGQVTNVSVVDDTPGTRIYQNSERNFTNQTVNGDYKVNWTLVGETDGIRNFSLEIDNATLSGLGVLSLSDAFFFAVTGDTGTVRKVLVYNQVDGTFTVEVQDGSGTTLGTCERSAGATGNISVTDATVEGQSCPALAFFGDLQAPYELTFNNTKDGGDDTIAGTYSLVVATAPGNLDPSVAENFGTVSGYDVPDIEPAVYAMTVEVVYRTPRLLYRTRIRVAPGEPDG